MLAIAGLGSLLAAVWLWWLEAEELSIACGLYGALALFRAGLAIFG